MTTPPTNRATSESKTIACQVIRQNNSELWSQAIDALTPEERFLCSDWPSLLKKTYGYEPLLVIAQQGDKVAGVMPLCEVNSPLTGKRGVSLPFFDIVRSHIVGDETIQSMYDQLVSFGKKQKWDYLELRGDFRKLNIEDPSLSFYNHVVDLTGGSEAVFSNLASSTRRAVRKAEKVGVKVEFSNTMEALKGFYDLQFITRKRHGLPPQPFRFFRNLREALIVPGKGVIISAYHNDQLAASGIYLEQGSLCHYKYGASDTRFQVARCNNYVMWSAMKHFAERGFKAMDLGRNSLENESLRKYKQTYGPSERLTYYHRYDLKNDKISKMTDDVYGWHNKIFAILPRSLSQLAGSLLYKHIA